MSDPAHPPGKHPNSLANLTYRDGRPTVYGSPKKRREVTVTEEGWTAAQAIAQQLGCTGISDLIEKIGRDQLKVFKADDHL